MIIYGILPGEGPVIVPVKLPAMNCPIIPYSVIFTAMGVTIVEKTLNCGQPKNIRFCELLAAMPVCKKPMETDWVLFEIKLTALIIIEGGVFCGLAY